MLWPPAGLSEQGWRQRIEDLATRAEALIGRKCTLQDSAALSLELIGLIWPAVGPETVAASCRASLAVGPPGLLMAASGGDQWAEIHSRLDDIFAAAQADPSAAAVERPSVMLQRVIPENHAGRPKRVRVQPQVVEPEPELIDHGGDRKSDDFKASQEQQDQGTGSTLKRGGNPDYLQARLRRDAPEVAADHLGDAEPIDQAVEAIQQLNAWGFVDEPELELELEPEPASLPPAPADWFTASEAAELLGISRSTILRWCKQGRLGEPGENWLPAGRTFKVDPALLELLIGVPAGSGT